MQRPLLIKAQPTRNRIVPVFLYGFSDLQCN